MGNLLSLPVLCGTLGWALTQEQQPLEAVVGLLMPLVRNPNGAARAQAILWALACIEAGDTTYCPQCAKLHGMVRVVPILKDTGSGKNNAVQATQDVVAAYPNVTGFLGPCYSSNAEAVANFVQSLSPVLPVVSPAATDPMFSNKDPTSGFPHFFRTVPPDTVVAQAMIRFVQHLGWRELAGAIANDNQPKGISDKLSGFALQAGVQYQARHYTLQDFPEFDALVAFLRQPGSPRVLVAVGAKSRDTFQLFSRLRMEGLLAGRVVLSSDLVAGGNALRAPEASGSDAAAIFVRTVSFKSASSGGRLELFARDWPMLLAGLDLTMLRRELGSDYTLPQEYFQQVPSYVVESVEATILYITGLLEQQRMGGRSTLVDGLKVAGAFTCINDGVELNQQGDRMHTQVAVYQHQGALDPVVVGSFDVDADALALQSGALQPLPRPSEPTPQPARTGKSTPTPSPAPAPAPDLSPLAIGLIAAGTVSLCLCLGGVAYARKSSLQEARRKAAKEKEEAGRKAERAAKEKAEAEKAAKEEAEKAAQEEAEKAAKEAADAEKAAKKGIKHVPRSSFDDDLGTQEASLRMVVIGAGPVGLTVALCLAEFAVTLHKAIKIIVYELRMRMNDNDELEWSGRRRSQVVTLQDHVVSCFENLKDLQQCFNFDKEGKAWEKVWKDSRNIPIGDLEDLLLERAKKFQQKHRNLRLEVLPEHLKTGLRGEAEGGVWRDEDQRPTPEGKRQWKKWIEGLKADVVIAADGTSSLSRESFDDTFQRVLLGEVVEGQETTTDYALGLGLECVEADNDPQPQKYNTAITLGQNRFLLNSLGGTRGYLNIRLTEAEFDEFQRLAQTKCTFGSPCALWPRTEDSENPTLQVLRTSMGILDTHMREGLQLFGLGEQNVKAIECFQLTPAYFKRFWCRLDAGPLLLLVGDAAISHHFWPGRGMNTSLKAAFMAACCLWKDYANGCLGQGNSQQVAASSAASSSWWPMSSPAAPVAPPVLPSLDEFDRFMDTLREREMQGRSLSMLKPEAALPKILDEIVQAGGCKTGQDRFVAQQRKWDEINKASRAEADTLTKQLAERFAHWQALTPFKDAPDIREELLSTRREHNSPLKRSTKPSPACMKVLFEAACENKRNDGRPSLWGWPIRLQRGEEVEPKNFKVADPLHMHRLSGGTGDNGTPRDAEGEMTAEV